MLGAQYAFIETVHISNAVTATLFQFLGPVLITMYVAFEQRKFPAPIQLLAIITALTGTYFIITNGSIENIVLSKEAIIFGLLTAIGFAFYTLHPASLIKECGTIVVIGWGMLIGGIALLICNRSFEWTQLSQTFTLKTFSMLILIIISGTLSFLLYIGSLKYLAATETSILSSIEPLVAAIVSIAWLNESFGAYQLLGGLCIVLSVIFLTMPQKKMKLPFQLNKYKNVKRGRTKLTTSFDVLKELSRFLANTITLTIKIRCGTMKKSELCYFSPFSSLDAHKRNLI